MDRWLGKIAVVTGASAGIGSAIAVTLANKGLKVVGLARRAHRIEELKNEIEGPGELFAFKADVSEEGDVKAAFNFVRSKFGAVHVLVNNAGVVRPGKLVDQDPKLLREVLDINVMGLTLCTQQALKLMKEAGVDDGHIIHINSVCGHQVLALYEGNDQLMSMYSPSKYAVTAITETLRQELRFLKSKIKVSSLSPGHVKTEVVQAALAATGTPEATDGMEIFTDIAGLEAQDIADGVVYILSTPPGVQVSELTIKPVGEQF